MAGRVGTKVTKPTEGFAEPHIGSTVNDRPKPKVEPSGSVRGGTTNPPKGESGDIARFDAAGKPVKGSSKKES